MAENKTYKLKSITLMESNFQRNAEIEFKSIEISNDVDIDIQHTLLNEDVLISMNVKLTGRIRRKKIFTFQIKYDGQFEVGDEEILPVEKFVDFNGPAIIYPFVREHIGTTSLKAGLQSILLPPVNFVKLNSDRKEKLITKG